MEKSKLFLKYFGILILVIEVLIVVLFLASIFTFISSLLSFAEAQKTNALQPITEITPFDVRTTLNLPIKNNGFFDLRTRFNVKVMSINKTVLAESFSEKTIKPNEKETLSVTINMPMQNAMNTDSIFASFDFKTLNDLISMKISIEIPKAVLGALQ